MGCLPSFVFLRKKQLSFSVLDSLHLLVTTPIFHFVFLELSTDVESNTLRFVEEATESTGKKCPIITHTFGDPWLLCSLR